MAGPRAAGPRSRLMRRTPLSWPLRPVFFRYPMALRRSHRASLSPRRILEDIAKDSDPHPARDPEVVFGVAGERSLPGQICAGVTKATPCPGPPSQGPHPTSPSPRCNAINRTYKNLLIYKSRKYPPRPSRCDRPPLQGVLACTLGSLLTCGQPEPQVEVPILRRVPVPVRRSAVPGVVVPATPAIQAVRGYRRPPRTVPPAELVVIPVGAPLPDVPQHVVKAPRIGPTPRRPHLMRLAARVLTKPGVYSQ